MPKAITCIHGISPKNKCKECKKEKTKKWKTENSEHIKKYNEDHKEKKQKYNKKYRKKYQKEISKHLKKWYKNKIKKNKILRKKLIIDGKMPYCMCGCREYPNIGRKFIKGHQNIGIKKTKEWIEFMREFMIGNT